MNLSPPRRWQAGFIVVYALLILYGIWNHEPWRDEAQSWLLARDLPLGLLLEQMKFEGSPALWHLILFPFAQLGLPYLSMHLVHAAIIIAAVWLLITRAPFPWWAKGAVAFSYFFVWEYAVIARCYALIPLLLFVIASRYATRLDRPLAHGLWVALLANTSVHGAFIAAALGTVYGIECLVRRRLNRGTIAACLWMLAGGLAVLWQVYRGPHDSVFYPSSAFSLEVWTRANVGAFLPQLRADGMIASVVIGAAVTLFLGGLFVLRRSAFFLCLLSYLGLMYVFCFRWMGSLRHWGLVLVVCVFSLWLALDTGQEGAAEQHADPSERDPASHGGVRRALLLALSMILVVSSWPAWGHYVLDGLNDYSEGAHASQFLLENELLDQPIIGTRAELTISLLPYLEGTRLWDPATQRFHTFITWDRPHFENVGTKMGELIRRVKHRFGEETPVIYLVPRRMPKRYRSEFELLASPKWGGYQAESGDETFFIYRYGGVHEE